MKKNTTKASLKDFFAHQRVCRTHKGKEEIFDLYQLGQFSAPDSFLSAYLNEPIPEGFSTDENLELVELQPEAQYQPHFHQKSAAVIYIISGTGIFFLGDQSIKFAPSHRLIIPAGVKHGFKTDTYTLFLSIQSPPIIHPETQAIDIHY